MVKTLEPIVEDIELDLSVDSNLENYRIEQESAFTDESVKNCYSSTGCYSSGCYSSSGCIDCYSVD